ncbi:MAG: hypothetical protein OEU26_02770 [Candidatus Tectomicrobia bacterium]|nr:hypothetical protein [Candidatus Tectomicrobia bacterium]
MSKAQQGCQVNDARVTFDGKHLIRAHSVGWGLPEIKTGFGVLHRQKLAARLIRKAAREGSGFTHVHRPRPGNDLRHCAGSTKLAGS